MSAKWLEARWDVLIPQVVRCGIAQEEEIRRLCEEEIAAWKSRSRCSTVSSLRTPLTQTRNRVRQLDVTAENSWVNPKTRKREHLALKYLTLSADEWMQLRMPSEQSMQRREAQPLWLSAPDVIVERGTQLLEGRHWADVVLGIVVNTGRSLSEILKGGRFHARTTYSLVFERRNWRLDRPQVTLEIPSFARAEQVIAAQARVRRLVPSADVNAREISVRYGPVLREAAYRHFLGVVPLRQGASDLYQALLHGVYPRLAVYYYCPDFVDDLVYMATIQGQTRVLEAISEEERRLLRRVSHSSDYRMVDERKGIWLGKPGVELLAACAWMRQSGNA